MFCKECGVEFRDERKVCGYCGAARPSIDEWELDWEDAARLREERDVQTAQAVVTPAPRFGDADSCVRPGDPRQKCADCGKELPASAMSNVCALCSIRRNDREAALERQRDAVRPAPRDDRSYLPTRPATSEYDADSDGGAWHNEQMQSERDSASRERNAATYERETAAHTRKQEAAAYKQSRERDASAYTRDTASYQQEAASYERASAAEFASNERASTAESAAESAWNPSQPRFLKKTTRQAKLALGIIIGFVVIMNVLPALAAVVFNFFTDTQTTEISTSVEFTTEENILYEQFIQPCANDLFASITPELRNSGKTLVLYSDAPNFLHFQSDFSQLGVDGINNYLTGTATFSLYDELYDLPFRACFVFTENSYAYTTYLEIMDTVYWDYTDQSLETLIEETPITLYDLVDRYNSGEYDSQSSTAADRLPASVSTNVNGVNVSVDPMIEMLSVIQYLSDYDTQYGLLTQQKTSYHDDLEAFFRPYEDHAAVNYFNSVMEEGFAFDIPPTACLYLDDTFSILPEFEGSDFQRNRMNIELQTFRDLMKAFYVDTNFAEFYEAHQGFYRNMIDTYAANFPTWNMTEAMENYYGKHAAGYHIVLVPLFHPGGFGPSLEFYDGLHIYSVQGPYQAENDTPLFGDSDSIANLVIHEFGHSFVPVNERDNPVMVAEVVRSEYLMDAVREDMERNAYSDWTSAYEELVLRAAVIDIMRQNTTVDPESLLEYEREVGFLYIDTAYEAIQAYSSNRAQYPVFDEFVPVITDALRAAYPRT